jgi:predicted permease
LNAILDTVLPVFGMIVLGFAFARGGIIGADATRGITLFVFNAAIPALLFRTVASIDGGATAPWELWLVFFSGLAITWLAAAVVARWVPGLSEGGGASASMAAGFGNLALLGTPLALAHFGREAAIPLGMILSIHAPLLWFAATFHRELARHSATFSLAGTARELFMSLAGNAIVLALVAGSLWRLTGFGLNSVVDRMLAMLSEAGVPTALFALGLSLAGYSLRGAWSGVAVLLALKMVLMPVLVWLGTRLVPGLPPDWAKVAVLFAAMPTGANAFLFARRNEESVAAVSGAIALGTGLAAATVSVLLYAMDRGPL